MTSPPDWDARYSAPGYAYGTEPNGFLASVATRIPAGPVLCLAEGEGRNAVYLAGLGHPVTMVERSAAGVAKARALAAARGVTIDAVAADLAEYAIAPGTWSGIVAIFAHLPPALRARVHRGVVAGLAPGGAYVLEAYTPDQIALGTGGPRTPELLMTAEALRGELAGLDCEILREVERDVREGSLHTGRAAVVQVVGRKPPAAG
jgi:hypothetical protein